MGRKCGMKCNILRTWGTFFKKNHWEFVVNLIKAYRIHWEHQIPKRSPSPSPLSPTLFFYKKHEASLWSCCFTSLAWVGGPLGQVPTSANQQKEKVMHTRRSNNYRAHLFSLYSCGSNNNNNNWRGEAWRRGGMEGGRWGGVCYDCQLTFFPNLQSQFPNLAPIITNFFQILWRERERERERERSLQMWPPPSSPFIQIPTLTHPSFAHMHLQPFALYSFKGQARGKRNQKTKKKKAWVLTDILLHWAIRRRRSRRRRRQQQQGFFFPLFFVAFKREWLWIKKCASFSFGIILVVVSVVGEGREIRVLTLNKFWAMKLSA